MAIAPTPTKFTYNPLSGYFDRVIQDKAQIITVGKSGCQYTTIQAAINAITDATINKTYVIQIHPGVYTEALTGKPYISYTGIAGGLDGNTTITSSTTLFSGTLSDDYVVSFTHINFLLTPTTDNQAIFNVTGALGVSDCALGVATSSDVSVTMIDVTTNSVLALNNCSSLYKNLNAGTTKAFTGVKIAGTGLLALSLFSIRTLVAASSGVHQLIDIDSTGQVVVTSSFLDWNNSVSFSGQVKGVCVSTATTATRVIRSTDIRLIGTSGGTATGLCLNSSGNSAQITYDSITVSINGFANEYITETAVGDTHKVFLSSTNKTLQTTGSGLAIITPLTLIQTGRDEWSSVGSTYWSYNTGTKVFTVDKRGTGLVLSAPVVWSAGQSTTGLTDKAVNFVYMNSSGVIGFTTSPNSALYENNIVLFQVWVQGTNYIVCREDHPIEFTTAVSRAWHNLFGSLLQDSTTTLARNNASLRTVNLVGSNTLTDHGLDQSISSQTPITWNQIVTGTSGYSYHTSVAQGLAAIYSDATNTTGTAIPNGSAGVWRLGVVKGSLNSSVPQFIAYAHTATFATANAARNAVAAGTIAAFPSEMKALEIAQLGFCIISVSAGGVATIAADTDVVTALQVFGAQFVGGGTSTSGSLITLTTTDFGVILSGTDTNVQVAMDTIDNTAAKKATSSTDNALARFDGTTGQLLKNSAITVDDSGNMTIAGDLTVNGTNFIANTETVLIEDNLLVINKAETGAGVTGGTAGIEVERGTLTNYQFIFDETTDSFKIGEVGSLQKVATREDTPTADGLAIWNNSTSRFDTTLTPAVTSIQIDGGTAGAKKIVYDSVNTRIDINNSKLLVADTGAMTVSNSANSNISHNIWGNKLALSRASTATIGIGNSSDLGFIVVNGTGNTDAGFFRVYQQTLDGTTKNFISIATDKDGAVTLGPDAGLASSLSHITNGSTDTATSMNKWIKKTGADSSSNYFLECLAGTGTTSQGGLWNNASGDFATFTSSDERIKTDIRDAEYGLSDLMRLRARTYTKEGIQNVKGFIAQEVKEVLPESVGIRQANGFEDFHILETQTMIPLLVKSIQELNAKIEALEARLQ